VLSTFQYTRKRKEIQEGIFIPSNHSIIFVSSLFSLLVFLIFMYLTFLLLISQK
jgi:putative membrane protein